MANLPSTLEEWRAIAVPNSVIRSREAYEKYIKTRKSGNLYAMGGAIEITRGLSESLELSDSERKKVVPLFHVKVFFHNGAKSGTYDLRLNGNAIQLSDEGRLEQILLAHGRVEEAVIGGNYKFNAFVVNYLNIPGVVEAVVFNQKVKCIKTA